MVASPQPSREGYSPSERVVRVVADENNVDPLDLPPLQHTIDADALDATVDCLDDGTVEFDYADHSVTVHADGRVTVSTESTVARVRSEPAAED